MTYRLDKTGKPQTISTGHTALDEALRGGWPRGHFSELALGAPRPVGFAERARLLAADALAACQRAGGVAALLDTDASAELSALAERGVDVSRLLLSQPDRAEDVWTIAGTLVRSGAVDLVVIWGDPPHAPADVRALHAATWRTGSPPLVGGTAVLFVAAQPSQAVKYYASLRVTVRGLPVEGNNPDTTLVVTKASRYIRIGGPFARVDVRLGVTPPPANPWIPWPDEPQTEREVGELDGDDDAREYG